MNPSRPRNPARPVETDRGRAVSPDEDRLWRRVTDGVTPLADRPPPPETRPEAKAESGAETRAEPGAKAAAPPAGRRAHKPGRPAAAPPPPPAPSEPEMSHGEAPGLDKRTRTRLRRGQVPVEARIDLHGLTQAEAHRALLAFLEGSRDAGRRCVLVVTGKGAREGTGVLRDGVPKWLNEPRSRAMVRAFSHAAPKDGGEGALYVLLRRRR